MVATQPRPARLRQVVVDLWKHTIQACSRGSAGSDEAQVMRTHMSTRHMTALCTALVVMLLPSASSASDEDLSAYLRNKVSTVPSGTIIQPFVRFDCRRLIYNPLSPAEFTARLAEIQGRPEHPDRELFRMYAEINRTGQAVVDRWISAVADDQGQWRVVDRIGFPPSLATMHTVSSRRGPWRAWANQPLEVAPSNWFDPTGTMMGNPVSGISSTFRFEINRFLIADLANVGQPHIHRFDVSGTGSQRRFVVELARNEEAARTSERWVFHGRVVDGPQRLLPESLVILEAAGQNWSAVHRASYKDWRFNASINRWLCHRVERLDEQGRLKFAMVLDAVVPVTPEQFQASIKPPPIGSPITFPAEASESAVQVPSEQPWTDATFTGNRPELDSRLGPQATEAARSLADQQPPSSGGLWLWAIPGAAVLTLLVLLVRRLRTA